MRVFVSEWEVCLCGVTGERHPVPGLSVQQQGGGGRVSSQRRSSTDGRCQQSLAKVFGSPEHNVLKVSFCDCLFPVIHYQHLFVNTLEATFKV
ncbi:hypothetical protein DPMN_129336 [Dreissena polymorpha]|uniref:Uncharacterized protein n=1 Tax=Dreissena polymorpha TaxID=45954 RepID=A0A9D4H5K8_DREPO|nr:hypothetical protein DPMN_129336 [Dreissena polymorpha]